MELETLNQGAEQYGTPLYIFCIDEMRDEVQKLREAFGDRAGLCYAMKANPFLTDRMSVLADRIEVCSMGEYRICRKQRIPAERLLISGVMKKREDIFTILNDCRGKSTYTAESLNQFHCFADWCGMNKETIRLFLRLSSGNQFGMDREMIETIIRMRDKYPFIKIQGIHYFSGTQKKAKRIREELAYLDNVLRELEEELDFRAEELEYGPGIAVSYFEGQKNTRESDIRELAGALDEMQWKGSVTLEMGRAFVSGCGYYLTEVQDIKRNEGRNYCIVDGGNHQMNYDGQIRGMYQPKLSICQKNETGQPEEWTVCGALCTVNDILVQKAAFKNLQTGDVLVFERTGAYSMTEGMSLFLSHALPKVAFYSKDEGYKLVRRKLQTYNYNMEEIR